MSDDRRALERQPGAGGAVAHFAPAGGLGGRAPQNKIAGHHPTKALIHGSTLRYDETAFPKKQARRKSNNNRQRKRHSALFGGCKTAPKRVVRAEEGGAARDYLTIMYPCISWWSAEQKFVQ